MGYQLSHSVFNDYIQALKSNYRLFAPVLQEGKGKFALTDVVGYGEIESFDEIVFDQKSYFSPKEIFYPIRETLFYFLNDRVETPEIDIKPVVIFARPCDLNGIKRLDKIFLKNGDEVDFYYLRRRNLVKFVMIECLEGFDTCFCVSMNSNENHDYEAVIKVTDEHISMKIVDESLDIDFLKSQTKLDFEPEFIQENKVKVTIPPVDSVTKATFDNEIWKEYTARCIACGRCNTSCITCSCYTMQDTKLSDDKKLGERRRIWAGCHVDGFSDMAGGHGFRDKNGERMRFKTMHKVNDFHKRFGEHMCVGCGRCDDVCPEYISFSKCINKLNQIVEEAASE
jgi:anaerobic sulfite reductase subunit A